MEPIIIMTVITIWSLISIIFIIYVLNKIGLLIIKISDIKNSNITSKDLFKYYKKRLLETKEEKKERIKKLSRGY